VRSFEASSDAEVRRRADLKQVRCSIDCTRELQLTGQQLFSPSTHEAA
jgi:hypothetical protein